MGFSSSSFRSLVRKGIILKSYDQVEDGKGKKRK